MGKATDHREEKSNRRCFDGSFGGRGKEAKRGSVWLGKREKTAVGKRMPLLCTMYGPAWAMGMGLPGLLSCNDVESTRGE